MGAGCPIYRVIRKWISQAPQKNHWFPGILEEQSIDMVDLGLQDNLQSPFGMIFSMLRGNGIQMSEVTQSDIYDITSEMIWEVTLKTR